MADCTKIVLEFNDGSRMEADGEYAQRIWAWYESCQVIACVHGASYDGPPFLRTAPKRAKGE